MLLFVLQPLLRSAVTIDDYARAEKFLPANVKKLVFKLYVTPHWINDTAKFWYRNDVSGERKEFIQIDPLNNTKRPAFDHRKLAASLSLAGGRKYSYDKLPFTSLDFAQKGRIIYFVVEKDRWQCDLKNYECKKIDKKPKKKLGASPDGKWLVKALDHNLHLHSEKNGETFSLTDDGVAGNNYAVPLPSAGDLVRLGEKKVNEVVDVIWSPDSQRFVTYRIDQRGAGKMHLVQSVPPDGGRPRLFSFAYPLPGETNVPKAQLYVFDIKTRKKIKVDHPPADLMYYGDPWWFKKMIGNTSYYFAEYERGFGAVKLYRLDLTTGKVTKLIEDRNKTYVDPNIWDAHITKDNKDILFLSERDGWNHLYRYDAATGKLKNRVTNGDWLVRYIVNVDEKRKRVYFIGSGREKGRNPYYRFLYRVNFNGSGLRLLTPENMDHSIQFSPDSRYFIDNYSLVNSPPVTVLRRAKDGRKLMTVERADISALKALGWNYPEAFRVKARDGKTDIYGVLYRPTNFDPNKKYPVIDKIYTGPHSFFAPKSFWAYQSMAQSIAELGFIVLEIDGMGTGKRSRAFHEVSYKNLGDGGIDDHIAGFKQLAEKYPYMDLERAGIFGFSAGGYDAFHAMCTHPEFYKVGVAASGNHDHRMDKTWWIELWMGFPLNKHYEEQSNLKWAEKLQGKILLAHGDLDENVNPSCTIQLVDALIKANKDFDLLIVPNKGHYLNSDPYFLRRRWDFFVMHLLGEEPPKGYRIESIK